MSPSNRPIDPIPEDLKPYYQGKNSAWQRWAGPVLRGVLLLAVIGLIVWGGIWGIGKLVSHNTDKKTASSNSQSANSNDAKDTKDDNKAADTSKSDSSTGQTAQTPPPAATPAPTPAPTATPPAATPTPVTTPTPTTPAPTPAPTPSATSQNAGQELANTGPGEIIAAVFGTIILATLGFYFASAYRVSAVRK